MPKPSKNRGQARYEAEDIEVLEGLEPVRRRPGMYIGGADENALHHLAAEAIDNAMDEAVAGQATMIEVELSADGTLAVRDNGRGIPIGPHPKIAGKSALEVVLTTLHAGGKFREGAYRTSGGLHGVGLSVVNALADRLTVEVARDQALWVQTYARGQPRTPLENRGAVRNRRGTSIFFHPDPDIFGNAAFRPSRLYRMARSKAYLFRGVQIRWSCAPERIDRSDDTPAAAELHFPGGLSDFLTASLEARPTVTSRPFAGEAGLNGDAGRIEWAMTWPEAGDGFLASYCNTVPTPQGGTHEAGLRAALLRGLKAYGELVGNRRAGIVAADDVLASACGLLSVFIRNPEFQGQTKDRLSTPSVAKLVENSLKDHFDHYLTGDPENANALLNLVLQRADERLKRREAREFSRKAPTRKLRLPGKLADCTRGTPDGTELFLVEGDSAGGSAKQARDRETQAVLPLRGKILNVASATSEKLRGNQELADLVQALGSGSGGLYDERKLRYQRVIIMTDADVDGAHIAALLMTFFFREMPELIENGHLYLALPPLFRLSQGGVTAYAMSEADKDSLAASRFNGRSRIEVSRFKGLGEMPAAQLKETTMDPVKRSLLRVTVSENGVSSGDRADGAPPSPVADLVERLMGRKPELRLRFIQENAERIEALDV